MKNGMGLLEFMLSFALFTILLIVAMRFYQSASTSMKENKIIAATTTIIHAANKWKLQNGMRNFKNISIETLQASHFLAESNYNPWGYVEIASTAADHQAIITFENIPEKNCQHLEKALKSLPTVTTTLCRTLESELAVTFL